MCREGAVDFFFFLADWGWLEMNGSIGYIDGNIDNSVKVVFIVRFWFLEVKNP